MPIRRALQREGADEVRRPVVNVLCAAPNGPNPGMATVDMAFRDTIAPRLGASVTYWRLVDQSEWLDPPGGSRRDPTGSFVDFDTGLTYQCLRGRLDEFLSADAVVFWGDFLHMAVYQVQVAHVLRERCRLIQGTEASERFVRKHLLLSETDSGTLSKVVTYGTTLGFNTPDDYGGAYGTAAEHFFGGVHRAWLRDPYSAFIASTFRPSRDPAIKAPDAAFLLPSQSHEAADNRLGVFIGRSDLSATTIGSWGAQLESRLGLRAEWIPWGHEPGFWPMRQRKKFRIAWPTLAGAGSGRAGRARAAYSAAKGERLPEEHLSTTDLLGLVAGCSLILTDTYHLAVNSWRMGVPTICLVDEPAQNWSVNSGDSWNRRDKRVDLYSQLDFAPLIVTSGELSRSAKSTLARVTSFLAGQDSGVGTDRLRRTRDAAIEDVVHTIHALTRSSSSADSPSDFNSLGRGDA